MKIVYTYVVGDILHKGHLLYLENAKAMGNKLIVGVLTDKAVMEKKPKPVMSFDERIEIIKSLKMVDVAVSQKRYSPVQNINKIKPNIVIESSSHDHRLIDDVKMTTEFYGGKVIILPYYSKQSSTKIKEKIKNGSKK